MCKSYRERLRRKRRYLWTKQDGRCIDCREPTMWFADGRGPIPPDAAMLTERRGAAAVACFRCATIAGKAAQALDYSASPVTLSDRARATMGVARTIEEDSSCP